HDLARGRRLPTSPAVSRDRGIRRCARGCFHVSIATLIVDDEPIARHAIVRLLRDDPDIQMPAMSGMDVVATIGAERMPATVFVTAFEQYAVRAFEANAVDYLVK